MTIAMGVFAFAMLLCVIGLCNAIRDAGRYIARALLECEHARMTGTIRQGDAK